MRTSRWLLAAAAVGAVALLLTTTDRGKKLRRDIADNAEDWKNHLSKLTAKGKKKLKKMAEHEAGALSNGALTS